MFFLVSVLLILSSCSTDQKQKISKDLESSSIQIACSIYDMNGVLKRSYNGSICIFNEDGTVLMATNKNKELVYYNQQMQIIWSKKMHLHHQLNQTSSGDFLVMTSEVLDIKDNKIRFDKILKINKHGDIISSFQFSEHQNILIDHLHQFKWDVENKNLADKEGSHINSFYEIGPNSKEEKLPYLKHGNFIVNSLYDSSSFILDSELKKVEKTIKIKHLNLAHDAQITFEGNLLLYVNWQDNGVLNNQSDRLNLWEINLENNNFHFSYSGVPGRYKKSAYCGGIQKINPDLYFFSDINNSLSMASFIDSNNNFLKEIRFTNLSEKAEIQQAKIIQADKFLALNHGP